jgi:hypothetical protein
MTCFPLASVVTDHEWVRGIEGQDITSNLPVGGLHGLPLLRM